MKSQQIIDAENYIRPGFFTAFERWLWRRRHPEAECMGGHGVLTRTGVCEKCCGETLTWSAHKVNLERSKPV